MYVGNNVGKYEGMYAQNPLPYKNTLKQARNVGRYINNTEKAVSRRRKLTYIDLRMR